MTIVSDPSVSIILGVFLQTNTQGTFVMSKAALMALPYYSRIYHLTSNILINANSMTYDR